MKLNKDEIYKLLDEGKGDEIVQETRGWDENKGVTFSQRKKENANDYRYFPDPDLPKLFLNKIFDIEKMRSELPELPEDLILLVVNSNPRFALRNLLLVQTLTMLSDRINQLTLMRELQNV